MSGASLHAKTFSMDGERVFVGSFNFGARSANLNTESGFLIDSPSLARRIDEALHHRATAIWLAVETKGLLIGEAANRPVIDGIRELAADVPSIERVHEVLTMHMGPDFLLVNISVKFAPGTVATDMEAAIAGLDARIKGSYPEARRIFVEAEGRAGA
nr:phospholipase D-like domain-containing protein [Arhodomonas aquaeolei]